MTPDDLPDAIGQKLTITYRTLTSRVTRFVWLRDLVWFRDGLTLLADMGYGTRCLPYKWKSLEVCEVRRVKA